MQWWHLEYFHALITSFPAYLFVSSYTHCSSKWYIKAYLLSFLVKMLNCFIWYSQNKFNVEERLQMKRNTTIMKYINVLELGWQLSLIQQNSVLCSTKMIESYTHSSANSWLNFHACLYLSFPSKLSEKVLDIHLIEVKQFTYTERLTPILSWLCWYIKLHFAYLAHMCKK